MPIEVSSCRHLGDDRLWVGFGDGREGVVRWTDPAPGPMTAPLRDVAFFAQARLNEESGALEWPNGFDCAPEYLYFLAFRDDPALHRQFGEWGYLAGFEAAQGEVEAGAGEAAK